MEPLKQSDLNYLLRFLSQEEIDEMQELQSKRFSSLEPMSDSDRRKLEDLYNKLPNTDDND